MNTAELIEAEWREACERTKDRALTPAGQVEPEWMIEAAEELLAVARGLAGVACETCGGLGKRTYGSTAAWAGGVGGAALTTSVCDRCWGTGRSDETGPDRREIARLQKQLAERGVR